MEGIVKDKALRKIQKDLPENWIVQFSTKHKDRVFYFNTVSGKSSWTFPNPEDSSSKSRTKLKPASKLKPSPEKTTGKVPTKGCGPVKKTPIVAAKHRMMPEKFLKPSKKKGLVGQASTSGKKINIPSIKTACTSAKGSKRKAEGPKNNLPLTSPKRPNLASKKQTAINKAPKVPTKSQKRDHKVNNLSSVAYAIKGASIKKGKIMQDKVKFSLVKSQVQSRLNVLKNKPIPPAPKAPMPTEQSSPKKINHNISDDVEMADISMCSDDAVVESVSSLPTQSAIIFIVVDTNVFLHKNGLQDINDIIEWYPLPEGHFRRAVVVVPWVVLQELDGLKSNKNTLPKARKAVAWLNRHFSSKKLGIRGQTIMEAATIVEGLAPENNDDRILQCCYFFKRLKGQHATFLYTHDKNLCNKALVSDFRTYSCFQSLKEGISAICKDPNPHFDNQESPSCFVDQAKNINVKKQPVSQTIEDFHDTSNDSSEITTLAQAKEMLCTALSSVLESEMEKAFGAELWKEVVYIKPPWSFLDVLRCIKKHWIAVFNMIGVDRLASVHCDALINSAALSTKKKAKDTSQSVQHETSFLTSAVQLLSALVSRRNPHKKIQHSLRCLQDRLKNLSEPKKNNDTDILSTIQPCTEATQYEDEVSSTVSSVDSIPSSCDMTSENCEDINNTVFWQVLDQVWTCIVSHTVAILKSLSFMTSSLFNQSPPEIKEQMMSSNIDVDIPSREMSMGVLPLFLQLIEGLYLSLERILNACNGQGHQPPPSHCLDLLQSMWTTCQAFSLSTEVECLRPELVQQCVYNDNDQNQLRVGLEKLLSVHKILDECRTHNLVNS
uniref:Transcriptional protein SWT1-like n=1 Tax=Phallusia mammillata TaxID=59560 RepID=A0A6F9DTH3_9ASCI|nr:transcriptional protein SWT1-like [Phallusia mammillata]